MKGDNDRLENSIQHLTSQSKAKIVSGELNRILTILRSVCPEGANISFDFDGELHVHIDIRKLEDVTLIESILPTLFMGIFRDIRRGRTPHRAFFHRVSAKVDI